MALARNGELEQAAEHFRSVLKLQPGSAPAHYQLGLLSIRRRNIAEALAHWREAARLDPHWPQPLNNLAWILATTPHPELRNGVEAVQLATQAAEITGTNDLRILDTLAAACAKPADLQTRLPLPARHKSLPLPRADPTWQKRSNSAWRSTAPTALPRAGTRGIEGP